MITEKRLLKIFGLAISLFFWFVIFNMGICHAQTQTGYRIPARLDIGGGRMTGDMYLQAGTSGVRLYFGTQSVTQVGTTGVITGTIATNLPYISGSTSINFVGFSQVLIGGAVIGTTGSSIAAIDGEGTRTILNSPHLKGVGTSSGTLAITGTLSANSTNISPTEVSYLDTVSSNIQSQFTTVTGSISSHGHGGTDTIKIDHDNLIDKGTNTHTQIDDFIASKAAALGVASLNASSLVVQGPASGTSTPTASSIVMTNSGTTTISDAWIGQKFTRLGTPTTDVISEGSTNKYYSDARVNSAVGSLTLNQLSDTKNLGTITNGQFVKRVGSGYEGASASVTVGWPDIVVGTLTGNSDISGTPTANKLVLSNSDNLNNWVKGTLTVTTIQATSTASTFGTTTQANNSVLTISGSGSSPLSIVGNSLLGNLGTGTTNTMTGTTTSGHTVTPSSQNAAYAGYLAFDKVLGEPQRWIAQTQVATLTYDFGTGTTKVIGRYDLAVENSSTDAPTAWEFAGSNDNINYVGINYKTGYTWDNPSNPDRTFNTFTIATSTTAYQFYRLKILTMQSANNATIEEMRLIQDNLKSETILYINGTNTVFVGTTTANSTSTAYILQVAGSALATSWGVTCYEAIKSIVDSGSETIKQGYDAVMQTKLFTHHPKIRNIKNSEAEHEAKVDYIKSFYNLDYETFKNANISAYRSGTGTVNWNKLRTDFETQYVQPRYDEFYILPDMNKRINDKKVDLESDTSITNISPVSDDPSTPEIFKRGDPRILDLQNQIGALIGTAQYQDARNAGQAVEIKELEALVGSATKETNKQKKAYQAMMDAIERLGGTVTITE